MNNYKPKKLIDGAKVNEDLKGKKAVAVPHNKRYEDCVVIYDGEEMFIGKKEKPLEKLEFPNKYGEGYYTLHYFAWEPNRQTRLL